MNRLDQMRNTDENKAKEINLKELFLVIKRRLWIISAVTLLAIVLGIILNNTTTVPLYQASSRIIIGADEETRKTLQVIVKDSIILDKVVKELNLNTSSEALAGQISVASIDASQVVGIGVIDPNPIQAAKIADTTAEIFKKEVPLIVGQDYVRLLSKAKVKDVPINPKNNNKIIIAIIAGLVISIGLAFLLESLDDRIRSEKEIESILGVQVLGRVPRMNKNNIKKKKTVQLEMAQRGETIGNK
jgi:capsular polysaccharide biosynthesis protein